MKAQGLREMVTDARTLSASVVLVTHGGTHQIRFVEADNANYVSLGVDVSVLDHRTPLLVVSVLGGLPAWRKFRSVRS